MARILVNYTYNKTKDEFKIIESDTVYADMKVAVLETEDDIRIPLVVPVQNMMTVVDKERYEQVNKKFYLVADEKGIVSENPQGAEIWLPKDTDISKLRFINGRLVMVQDEEPAEKPSTNKPKKKANKDSEA